MKMKKFWKWRKSRFICRRNRRWRELRRKIWIETGMLCPSTLLFDRIFLVRLTLTTLISASVPAYCPTPTLMTIGIVSLCSTHCIDVPYAEFFRRQAPPRNRVSAPKPSEFGRFGQNFRVRRNLEKNIIGATLVKNFFSAHYVLKTSFTCTKSAGGPWDL